MIYGIVIVKESMKLVLYILLSQIKKLFNTEMGEPKLKVILYSMDTLAID